MPHKRTEIRNALVSTLEGASIVNLVYANRVHGVNNYPVISVYDDQETSTPRDTSGRNTLRKLSVKIEIRNKEKHNTAEALDELCLKVEDALKANLKLNGTATGLVYQGTDLDFDAADTTLGMATLTYEITYLT